MDGIKTIKVGLLGCGTVGGGVAIVLNENREDITRRSGCRIEIAKVLLRNAADPNEIVRKYGLPVTDRIEDIVEDPDIQIVVELMGRIHPAKEYIEAALAHGKNVVTSNKDLIAEYGEELLGLAGKKGVDFQFEGSVGGGIPIIMPLKNCLAANRITSIMGIVNGTTNYMLTRMEKAKLPYAEALKEAQNITEALYHGSIAEHSEHELEQAFGKMPTVDVTNEDKDVVNWLIDANIYKSKRQAREDINNGAVTINGVKVTSLDEIVKPHKNSNGKFVIVRKGKKKYTLARVQQLTVFLNSLKFNIDGRFSVCYNNSLQNVQLML